MLLEELQGLLRPDGPHRPAAAATATMWRASVKSCSISCIDTVFSEPQLDTRL